MTVHSPPRRILHLGNVLNNAYLNVKLLRRRGWDASAVAVDYWHVQGQPEWDEVAISDARLSHYAPDWRSVDLKGFARPWWFQDPLITQIPRAVEHLEARTSGDYRDALHPGLEPQRPDAWRSAIRRLLDRLGIVSLVRAMRRQSRASRMKRERTIEWSGLVEDFRRAYPDASRSLTASDVSDHAASAVALRPLLERYPLVQAYGLDPIHVLVANPSQPLICYEHGTLRDFPFEDSSRGRLYALALKRADRIVITNQDCNLAADRLGLTNYTFIPHVVDEDTFYPARSSRREALLSRYGCDRLIVAPARHHWKHAPAGLENSWFKRNDIAIRGLRRLFHRRPDLRVLVVFFEWGQEVALSKALIRECGFEHRAHWEPICSKPVMRDFYNAADVVLDQFSPIGAFGTVVPEALACAKPVILNFQRERHVWCYGDPPPCVNAETDLEVEHRVDQLLQDAAYRHAVGEAGLAWFRAHHSTKVVGDRHIDVYRTIAERRGWRWGDEAV